MGDTVSVCCTCNEDSKDKTTAYLSEKSVEQLLNKQRTTEELAKIKLAEEQLE